MAHRVLLAFVAATLLLRGASIAQEGSKQIMFKRTQLDAKFRSEGVAVGDFNGDGRLDIAAGSVYARPSASGLWKLTPISASNAPGTDRFSHGIGAGDINGDGRTDVVVTEGWWEAPADKAQSTWVFHPVKFGGPCSQMYVYDFD